MLSKREAESKAEKVGLVVNASKTKFTLVGGTGHVRTRQGSNVTIDGDTFELVEKVVYLEEAHQWFSTVMRLSMVQLEKKLGTFQRPVLSTTFGGVQENSVWRRRMNHELAALYDKLSIQ